MPILVPEDPSFVTASEQKVSEALREQLGKGGRAVRRRLHGGS